MNPVNAMQVLVRDFSESYSLNQLLRTDAGIDRLTNGNHPQSNGKASED
jgi:hypothetical protein